MAKQTPAESRHLIDDTIVAIATPLGEGGLGVIRLSGPKSIPIADRLFSISSFSLKDARTHTLHHGWIKKNQESLDEAVASLYRAPHSYTGEDVVEFSCHGSPALLNEILILCQAEGARLAKPGEFTERAFLNGKLDLSQAEAVADLISARSERARREATHHLQGHLSQTIRTIRESMISLLAHIEANLDFVEDDIPGLPKERMKNELNKQLHSISVLLGTGLKGRLLRTGLRVVFTGKPNVGKSSLFNALLTQDRAIVTHIPGTTRDTLEESVQWEGYSLILIDTAGLRQAAGVIEKQGATRTKKAADIADVVLFILDGSRPIVNEDKIIFETIKNKNVIVVCNKSDKNPSFGIDEVADWRPGERVLRVSAKTGEGLSEMKNAVLSSLGIGRQETESVPLITNLRHIQHLEKANECLRSALKSIEKNKSEEAVSVDVRGALDQLGAITGESVSDEMLASIFDQFCIGK